MAWNYLEEEVEGGRYLLNTIKKKRSTKLHMLQKG